MAKEKSHYSARVLDAAESAQALLRSFSNMGSIIEKAFVGAPSPAYDQKDWKKHPNIDRNAIKTVKVPGNKRAIPLSPARAWRQIVVMSVDGEELREIRQEYEGEDAIFYIADDIVRVGLSRAGRGFNDEDQLSFNPLRRIYAGMRLGRGLFEGGMCEYLPEEKSLVVPESLRIENAHLHVKEFHRFYPGAFLS